MLSNVNNKSITLIRMGISPECAGRGERVLGRLRTNYILGGIHPKIEHILPIPAVCPIRRYLVEICIGREEGCFIDCRKKHPF